MGYKSNTKPTIEIEDQAIIFILILKPRLNGILNKKRNINKKNIF